MLPRYAGIEPRRDVEYARRGTTARVASYTTLFDRARPQELTDRRLYYIYKRSNGKAMEQKITFEDVVRYAELCGKAHRSDSSRAKDMSQLLLYNPYNN